MKVSIPRLAVAAGTAFLGAAIYLGTTQPGYAEVDCTKPTKTNFEAATCTARRQAGLIKSEPPTLAKREPIPARIRNPPPGRTWEQRERDARWLCDQGAVLGCYSYYTWLANNPKPRN